VRWPVVKKNCNSAHRPEERLEQQVDWKQQYECLRQEALHLGAGRGHGLALFQSRGMMAWLRALTALKPRPVAQNVIEQSASLPSIPRSDLRALLASMVLACMGREAHEHCI
jgi:uncharacterized protein YfaQ (DUF2300 family)